MVIFISTGLGFLLGGLIVYYVYRNVMKRVYERLELLKKLYIMNVGNTTIDELELQLSCLNTYLVDRKLIKCTKTYEDGGGSLTPRQMEVINRCDCYDCIQVRQHMYENYYDTDNNDAISLVALSGSCKICGKHDGSLNIHNKCKACSDRYSVKKIIHKQ